MSASLIAIVTVIYIAVAANEVRAGNLGLAIAFAGYAAANVGLIMIAMR